jgi:hypothetical protein
MDKELWIRAQLKRMGNKNPTEESIQHYMEMLNPESPSFDKWVLAQYEYTSNTTPNKKVRRLKRYVRKHRWLPW